MGHKIKDWLDVRIGLDEIIKEYFTEYKTPKRANLWNTLGFVAFVAISVQVVTGILLLLYYTPHPSLAFDSVQKISNEISFGWLVRLIHNVGSNLIVAVVILHMLHVFCRGAFKNPRELTWLGGGIMFFLVLMSCISGQLLPWSQHGYWSTTVISSIPAHLPYIGDTIASFVKGGESVSALTLGRFFSFHVVILPFFLLAFIAGHILLIRRQGLSSSPELVPQNIPSEKFLRNLHPDGLPCFPHFSVKRLFMVFFYFAILFCILTLVPNLFLPEGSNIPANILKTPEVIKPPWYFLTQYQLIKSIPSDLVGIGLQVLMALVFLFFPFLDAKESERNIKKRPVLLTTFVLLLFGWCVFTIWGMN